MPTAGRPLPFCLARERKSRSWRLLISGLGSALPSADLVIDAAYGTGLQRAYSPPSPGASPVLAVDIPSGVSGLTGEVLEGGGAMRAVATVTFASLKPGLLFGAGPDLAGEVEVVDIGLGALVDAVVRCWLVGDADVAGYCRTGLGTGTSGRPQSRWWPGRQA